MIELQQHSHDRTISRRELNRQKEMERNYAQPTLLIECLDKRHPTGTRPCMTIGNAMVVTGLLLNQMKREVEASRGEIEVLLTLGATARQAIQRSLRHAVKSSMIPTIDGMKTVGLVQLPGMMTGMIIAGANPVEAVRLRK